MILKNKKKNNPTNVYLRLFNVGSGQALKQNSCLEVLSENSQ